jgi:hypothetical protein
MTTDASARGAFDGEPMYPKQGYVLVRRIDRWQVGVMREFRRPNTRGEWGAPCIRPAGLLDPTNQHTKGVKLRSAEYFKCFIWHHR